MQFESLDEKINYIEDDVESTIRNGCISGDTKLVARALLLASLNIKNLIETIKNSK